MAKNKLKFYKKILCLGTWTIIEGNKTNLTTGRIMVLSAVETITMRTTPSEQPLDEQLQCIPFSNVCGRLMGNVDDN